MVVLPAGQLPLVADETALEQLDDLTAIGEMHEATVLHALHLRWAKRRYFTRVGEMVIALRPPQALGQAGGGLPRGPQFDPAAWWTTREGFGASGGASGGAGEGSGGCGGGGGVDAGAPHVFEVAERCHAAALGSRFERAASSASAAAANLGCGSVQAVLVGGESGAGKSAAARLVVDYILFLGAKASARAARSGSDSKSGSGSRNGGAGGAGGGGGAGAVSAAVAGACALLGAFGHASTSAHDDSSRFGRLTEVRVGEGGAVGGVRITATLLEASRVTEHGALERNFHVFYQVRG